MGRKKKHQFDEDEVRAIYHRSEGLYLSLCEEVKFILEKRAIDAGIKIHSVEDRVKKVDSFLAKAKKRDCSDPMKEIADIAGLRVICLFKDDLTSLDLLIGREFKIMSKDDKSDSDDALGYQSVHYICELPENLEGARYESIQRTQFEIQVRTLCMHCWATVSHYIDYKGDWDVPQELKKALNALSGLFYVADSEFQQFNAARLESKQRAAASVDSHAQAGTEINFDTFYAYLLKKFPDREDGGSETLSELVQEAKAVGFKTIEEIDEAVDSVSEQLAEEETDYLTDEAPTYYTRAGAIRLSLRLFSDEFNALVLAKRDKKKKTKSKRRKPSLKR